MSTYQITFLLLSIIVIINFGRIIYRIYLNFKINRINKQLLHATNLLIKTKIDLHTGEVIKVNRQKNLDYIDPAQAVITDIFHMFIGTNKNEDFVVTLKERLPEKLSDYTPSKFIDIITTKSNETYTNFYAGKKAEYLAMDHYKSLGYDNVGMFASETHKNDDIFYIDSDGVQHDVSVKSYKSLSDFKNAVRNHPDSNEYAVNSELYAQIEHSGYIHELNSNGIKVVDANYSNEDLRSFAEDRIFTIADHSTHDTLLNELVDKDFIDISEVGNGYDSHLHIGLTLKLARNTRDLINNDQSFDEFVLNSGESLINLKAGAVAFKAGAAVGAAASGPAAPIGALVGGVTASIIAGLGTSKIMSVIKDNTVYSELIDDASYYAFAYEPTGNDFTELTLINLDEKIKQQIHLLNDFNIMKDKITIDKILPYIFLQQLYFLQKNKDDVVKDGYEEFRDYVHNKFSENKKMNPDNYGKYFGSILIRIFPKPDDYYMKKRYENFKINLSKHKKYPYLTPLAPFTAIKNLCFSNSVENYSNSFIKDINSYILLEKKKVWSLFIVNIIFMYIAFLSLYYS